jgi:hypothetical protein
MFVGIVAKTSAIYLMGGYSPAFQDWKSILFIVSITSLYGFAAAKPLHWHWV